MNNSRFAESLYKYRTCAMALALMGLGAVAMAAEVVVANIAPFSGQLASSSRDFNLGLQACVADLNRSGGVGGHKLRVISRDDAQNPAETTRHAQQLARSDAPVVYVGGGSGDTIAALNKTMPNIPHLAPQAELPILESGAAVFSLRPSRATELAYIGSQLATLGVRQIGILHSDDAAGREVLAISKAELAKHQLQVAVVAAFVPKSLALEAPIKTMLAQPLQSILLLADTQTSAAFVRGYRAAERGTLIVSTSSTEAEVLSSVLGPELARGLAIVQVTPSPYREVTSLAREFRQMIRRLNLPEERISHGSMGGYLACRVLAKAVQSSGSNPSAAALTKALQNMQKIDVGGFVVDFSGGRSQGSRYVDLSVLGDGGRVRQ